MSRSEFPADTFVAAAGQGIHLLRQRAPGGGGGDEAFSQVVVRHEAAVAAVCWNRNNKVVATGSTDGTIQLLYSSGQVMAVLPRDAATRPADMGAVTSLSWSSGSKRLAAGTERGSVYLFDMAQQGGMARPIELPGHLGGVTAVEYQHEDKFLAVASGGGSVTLYSDPQRTGAMGAVPLHPAADTSARLSLTVAAGNDSSVAAGSAAGSVTIWDAATQKVREHYAGQHSGGVAALGFLPLRPSMLYSAGADGRVCLQDRQAGPGHVSTFSLGAPATALMVKEDHSVLGVGTADGVVLLYDPRHIRQPLHTLPLEARAPVTSLHWQHRYQALPRSRSTPSAAAAAPAAAGGPAASRGPGPSRLGMPPSGSTAPAASAAAPSAAAPTPTPAVSAAASIGAAAASIGSCIPAAPGAARTPATAAPTPTAVPLAEPAGDVAASYASRPLASTSQPASSAAAVRAKLAAAALQLHPLSAARYNPAGDAADGRRTAMSAPGSRAMSPAAGAAASAAALQRSASSQAAAAQVPAAAPTPAASTAAGSAVGGLQVTPLHRPAAAQAAAGGLAVTPLPGMQPRHSAAAAAAEITPMQQQPLRGAEAAGDVAQRLQRLGVTPIGGSTPAAAAVQRQHAEQQQTGALTPLERLAAAPVDLNITPLVAPPAGRQLPPAAAAASGRRQAAAAPPPLDITPLAGGPAAADRRSQLCISPLPGMESEPQQAGSASPKGRSVLAERTNSGAASPGVVPLTSGRRGMLPRLASPLPAEPGVEQPPVHGSPSFAENQPLPSPAAGRQQRPGGAAADEKVKAAGVEAQVALTPAGSGVQWTIPTAPADAEMAEAAPSGARVAAELVSHPLEFSFAAAQRSLEQLSIGAAWGGSGGGSGGAPAAGIAEAAAGLPPGLRDDILALHWDMLQQFQAQQACMGQLVSQVLERNEALSAEVAALRKQLSQLTGRRDQFLWL